jgi:hypothetical protein
LRTDGPGLVLGLAIVAAAAGVAVVATLSCVPDLPADVPAPVPEAGGCGDGIIDLTAGEECDPGPQLTDGGVCSSNCKVVCPGLKWPANDHCYELQNAEKSLKTTAETVCNALNGSHVATFASEAELGAAVEYVRDNVLAATDYWVGLVDGTYRYSSVVADEPGWSPQCSGCYAHTDVATAPLTLPKTVEAGAGCVIGTLLKSDPALVPPWEQHACDSVLAVHVLCEREPLGTHARMCDGGACIDLVFTAGTKDYLYVSAPLTASQAEAYCASQRSGGSLVVLESRDEREQLWREIAPLDPNDESVWIGLATDDAGLWTWDDGTRSDAGYPPPWAVGEPHADAGRAFMAYDPNNLPVDNTLAQTASDETTALPFVCQFRIADGGP